MTGNKFKQLCFKTYYDNGEKCDGCPLNKVDICDRLTCEQASKTRYAKILKRFVKKREKEKRNNERKDTVSKMFIAINKERAKNETRKNNIPSLHKLQSRV